MSSAALQTPSPTDLHQEIACSFCGTPARSRRVTLYSEISTAFICDVCAPIAAAQIADIIARQEEESQNG